MPWVLAQTSGHTGEAVLNADIILDNVHGWIQSPNLQIHAAKVLVFRKKGYIFAAAYKAGHWDGYTRLVTRDGGYPGGLTEYLLERLGDMGFSPTVDDQRARPEAHPTLLPVSLTVELAQHQEEAVAAAVSIGRGVVNHPVGAGKTRVLIETARRLAVPTLLLVHRKDLLHQLCDSFRESVNAPALVGMIGDGRYKPNFWTCATFQSIYHRLKNYPADMKPLLDQFQAVLVDETHHAGADTYEKVLKALKNAYYRIGVSATPFKQGDQETFFRVTGLLGPEIANVTSQEGIDIGRLVPASVYIVDPGGRLPNDATYAEAVETGIVQHNERNNLIITLARRLQGNGAVLILCQRIAHGERLLRELHRLGETSAVFLSGRDAGLYRKEKLQELRSGTYRILISSVILDEGVDVKNIHTLIMAGGGKAQHKVVQRLGRGMRSDDGKDSLTVIDFADEGQYLGEQARSRQKVYRQEPAYTVTFVEHDEMLSWLSGGRDKLTEAG